jgi:hypothetical protein
MVAGVTNTWGASNRTAGRSTRPDTHDIKRVLVLHAEAVARAELGEPSQKSAREWRWGGRGSLWLGLTGAKRGRWRSFERDIGGDMIDLIAFVRNVHFSEAIRIGREYAAGHLPTVRTETPPSGAATKIIDTEERTTIALRIWDETRPIGGTLAEIYLAVVRGLDIARLDVDHALRWHAGAQAVVGLMTHAVTGDATGIHRTFLNPDGSKRERKMLGRQGVIRLSSDAGVTSSLGLAEGVEDALAVLLSGWSPVWAATSAGAIARFPVLPGIEVLTIFADPDDAGQRAAEACRDRWREVGLEAAIVLPGRLI